MDKQKLVAACLQRIEEQMSVTKKMMDEAQEQSNDYGQNKDRYDSFRTKILRQRDMYAKQYQALAEQLVLMQQINPVEATRQVQFGSVVCTNRGKYFVSTALGKVECEGQPVYAISISAPIYTAMEGKTLGNSFSFNGIAQTIIEIF